MAEEMLLARYGVTEAEYCAALAEQRPFIASQLGRARWSEHEELMAQVAYEILKSLHRWDEVGRPKLAAWAHSVARNVFLAWCRSPGAGSGPGKTTLVSAERLAEDGVEFVAVEPHASDDIAQSRVVLAQRLQEVIISSPDGAMLWRELFTPEGQVRGRTAHARIMQHTEVVVDPDCALRRAAGLLNEVGLEGAA